jgi:hypothetical protein
MGPPVAFIGVSVTALAEGGPALLAMLVVVSSLVPIALSWRLSLFQRILTPTVAGTVIMLIPITVMPVMGDMLSSTPDGQMSPGAVLGAAATLESGWALAGATDEGAMFAHADGAWIHATLPSLLHALALEGCDAFLDGRDMVVRGRRGVVSAADSLEVDHDVAPE